MRPTFRKLEIKDVRDVEKSSPRMPRTSSPAEDHRLLHHAGARADRPRRRGREDSLVLTTLGFTANEEMLLRALEAYSWCLEFPETVRRLYPRTHVKPGRAPRMIFIAERIGDGFLRKVRQLAFRELDCLTFLYLDVNGAQAVYFDAVERIRRRAEEPLGQTPSFLTSDGPARLSRRAPPGLGRPDGNGPGRPDRSPSGRRTSLSTSTRSACRDGPGGPRPAPADAS
jgi:hypothetical protein